MRLGVDNILNTTQMIDSEGNIDYDKISKFSTSDYAGIISYAFRPGGNQKLSVELMPKSFTEILGNLPMVLVLDLMQELFIVQILVTNLELC